MNSEPSDVRLALVTNGSAGWRTVRKRWEPDFAVRAPIIRHIEDHLKTFSAFTEARGARSLGHALGGRAAAASALRAGANVVLFTNMQNCPLVPLKKGVRYIVYGDCTTAQLTTMYGGKTLGPPGSWITSRVDALIAHGATFLGMSEWFLDALREERDIPAEQLGLLPFYVDAQLWRPSERPAPRARKRVLFIGAGFERKGGDIVYEIARLEAFRDVEFHIVSPDAPDGPPGLVIHRGLAPESPDLIRLTGACDVFLLPTRADTSSLSAMEAAACGVPAVISGIGGIPEIVRDGETGIIPRERSVEAFARALSTYLSNDELLAAHGRAARAHVVANYSKARHFAILEQTIGQAAERLASSDAVRVAHRGETVDAH